MTDVLAGAHRLDVSGRYLHPHWLGFLCTALAERGVGVVGGHALRVGTGRWDAHLEVDVPLGLDADEVARLAAMPADWREAPPVVLTRAEVARREDGLVRLRVVAPDTLGFLGRLLRRLSVLTLLPVEVTVATREGVVDDELVLAGIGGRPPSDAVVVVLERALSQLLVR